MLQLRPSCECCNADLPPNTTEAFICTFECTFCRGCTANVLKVKCRELRRRAFAEIEKAEGEAGEVPSLRG